MQTGENKPPTPVPEAKSRFPFVTKEPENFRCEFVVRSGNTVRVTGLARKGSLRRVDFNLGEKNQRTVLQTDKEYLIANGKRIYAENTVKNGAATADTRLSELMPQNYGGRAEFEETGRDGPVVVYNVRFDNDSLNEIVVHFHQEMGLIVRQEFFAVNGTEKTLQYSFELAGLSTEVEDSVFAVPAGFRKVSLAEFYKF